MNSVYEVIIYDFANNLNFTYLLGKQKTNDDVKFEHHKSH